MPAISKSTHREILLAGAGQNRAQASLKLKFEHDSESGRTILRENLYEPPLQVVRAFSHDDGTAMVHLHNVSGGLVGGDQLTFHVDVGRFANAQVTTTGATRVYRTRTELPGASQHNKIVVEEGGLLELLPDEIIPFSGAKFLQETFITLAHGAGLFWWEILAPGREARDEIFQYDLVQMKTRVMAGLRPIAAENICLSPAKHKVTSLARLGPYRYYASFYICRVGVDLQSWRNLESHLLEVTHSLTRPGEMLWGMSTLVANGLAVRCIGSNGREILPGLQQIWRRAKTFLYGRKAILPRKVN
jgi:urease accessory protein